MADVSRAIAADPSLAARYTARGNTVAVITDGTAVLGLGDIGPLAAMPVMEGKAVLFKHFGGVDAVPVCMETGTVEELVEAIARIAPTYGGINLEDISAPRCFEIERQLQERLDIPVFHDDQHGTAIVVLAGLINAAKVVGRPLESLRVVVSGAGAAGVAVTKLLARAGVARHRRVRLARHHRPRTATDLADHKRRLAATTNPRGLSGALGDALDGRRRVRRGVRWAGARGGHRRGWRPTRSSSRWRTPTPEVHPDVAARYAAVVATGRSDFPNQINNVLAFPGIFRGALDSGAAADHRGDEAGGGRAPSPAWSSEPTAERDRAERLRPRGGRGGGGGGVEGGLSPDRQPTSNRPLEPAWSRPWDRPWSQPWSQPWS